DEQMLRSSQLCVEICATKEKRFWIGGAAGEYRCDDLMLNAALSAIWRTDNDKRLSRPSLASAQRFVSDLKPAIESDFLIAEQTCEQCVNILEFAGFRADQP